MTLRSAASIVVGADFARCHPACAYLVISCLHSIENYVSAATTLLHMLRVTLMYRYIQTAYTPAG